jgi:hypothetical protein
MRATDAPVPPLFSPPRDGHVVPGDPEDISTFYLLKSLKQTVREFDEEWMKDAYLNGGGLHDAVSQYQRIAVRPVDAGEGASALEALNALRASVGIEQERTPVAAPSAPASGSASAASVPGGDAESAISKMLMRMSKTSVSKSPFLVPGAIKTAFADALGVSTNGSSTEQREGANRGRRQSVVEHPDPNPVWQKRRIGPDSEEEMAVNTEDDLAYFNVVGKSDDADDNDLDSFFGEVNWSLLLLLVVVPLMLWFRNCALSLPDLVDPRVLASTCLVYARSSFDGRAASLRHRSLTP